MRGVALFASFAGDPLRLSVATVAVVSELPAMLGSVVEAEMCDEEESAIELCLSLLAFEARRAVLLGRKKALSVLGMRAKVKSVCAMKSC